MLKILTFVFFIFQYSDLFALDNFKKNHFSYFTPTLFNSEPVKYSRTLNLENGLRENTSEKINLKTSVRSFGGIAFCRSFFEDYLRLGLQFWQHEIQYRMENSGKLSEKNYALIPYLNFGFPLDTGGVIGVDQYGIAKSINARFAFAQGENGYLAVGILSSFVVGAVKNINTISLPVTSEKFSYLNSKTTILKKRSKLGWYLGVNWFEIFWKPSSLPVSIDFTFRSDALGEPPKPRSEVDYQDVSEKEYGIDTSYLTDSTLPLDIYFLNFIIGISF